MLFARRSLYLCILSLLLHIVVVLFTMNRTNKFCQQALLSAIAIDYSKLNYVVSLKAAIQLIIGTILLWDSKSKLGPFLLGTAIIPVSSLFGLVYQLLCFAST